jgi:uncharacterized protein (TIGR00369 family)
MNEPTETSGTELVRGFLEHSPFARHVGLRLDDLDDGRATLTLPFSDDVVTLGDVIHGGAISTLVDVAATAAAWAGAEVSEDVKWGTASVTVDFLRPARATDLVASARLLRRGRSLCFCEVEVTGSDDGELVAKGLVTYRLG